MKQPFSLIRWSKPSESQPNQNSINVDEPPTDTTPNLTDTTPNLSFPNNQAQSPSALSFTRRSQVSCKIEEAEQRSSLSITYSEEVSSDRSDGMAGSLLGIAALLVAGASLIVRRWKKKE